jgi:hypothetical protein
MVHGEYGVFLGLDVGKGEHHAVGSAPDGKRPHDAPLTNFFLAAFAYQAPTAQPNTHTA